MTDLLHTATILLAWLVLSLLAAAGWYVALGPRRAERAYRRWET